MRLTSKILCTGIKASKGTFESNAFDSTTFHLVVDVAENSSGPSIGAVTRPFKFGDSKEFDKWSHLKHSWPIGGLMCDCEFDVVAGPDNTSKLALLAIRPAANTSTGSGASKVN